MARSWLEKSLTTHVQIPSHGKEKEKKASQFLQYDLLHVSTIFKNIALKQSLMFLKTWNDLEDVIKDECEKRWRTKWKQIGC